MSSSGIGQNVAQAGSYCSRAATHAGTAGRHNEDAYLNRPDLGLWAVADGAGGHEAGEVASAEVVGLLQSIEPGLSAADMLQEVRTRLEMAHARLREAASRRGVDTVMATTAVVVLAREDHFACLWAGDSPAFLLRGGTLTKITRDHSLVQDLVESGIISESEAGNHPQANIITRAVGADTEALNLDKRTGQLMAGDRLLLCSDGLSKTLTEDKLAELLAASGDASAERLVMAALEAQASDNVTVVTIDFNADDGSTTLEAKRGSTPASASASAPAGASADEHGWAADDDSAAVSR
jgi:protein phosphatase/serine/threonine-protein phosphatase Stp1